MFSYEISNILVANNFTISSEMYLLIVSTSPQIIGVKYNSYENCFEMWDDKCSFWKFFVYKTLHKGDFYD